MKLQVKRIKEMVDSMGADFFGIADLSPARQAIRDQGGDVLASFPRSISIGIALPHSIVDQLPNRQERAVAINYRHHAYDVINLRLDSITSRLASLLQWAKHRVMPIPAARRIDEERLMGHFSHKMGAHLAGLGWIGKSCLLVTPEVGPRVRWATVLTDAPLPPTGKAMEERCGECRQCVEICPVQAFTGRPFRENEPRSVRYEANKCDRYLHSMRQKDPETAVCGMCLYVCPHGRGQSNRP